MIIRNQACLIAVLLAVALPAPLAAQTDTLPPNVIISLDNSASMGLPACSRYSWRPNTSNPWGDTLWMPGSGHPTYYGYFNNDSSYVYATSGFTASATGIWPGWLLNWAAMSRTDVLRKVLIGGRYTGNLLAAECNTDWFKYYFRNSTASYNRFAVTSSGGITSLTVTRVGATPPIMATLTNAVVNVAAPAPFRGVINALCDKDSNGSWDAGAARFGLWLYNPAEGGRISRYINDMTLSELVTAIQNTSPYGSTPQAESHFEILHYFAQSAPHYYASDFTPQRGGFHDPYFDTTYAAMVPCRKSFVLMLTDAGPTQDQNIPGYSGAGACTHLPNTHNLSTFYNGPAEPNPPGTWPDSGTGMLDDVALYGHTTDLRPDLPGSQDVGLCAVYCFPDSTGSNTNLLRSAATAGAFRDINGDGLPGPNPLEWDEDGDSIPDLYFHGVDGWQLDTAVTRAIQAIMSRALRDIDLPDPSLLSPPDSQLSDDDTPTLCWGLIDSAKMYRVQVSTDSLFGSCAVDSVTIMDDTTITCPTLPDSLYFWRVKAYNFCNRSPWSPSWRFRIESPLSVQLSLLVASGRPGGGIVVRWRTECEHECYQWRVERSTEVNSGYRAIGELPGHGTSSQGHDYQFVDETCDWPESGYFYRLAEIDMQGAVTYHGPVKGTAVRPIEFALLKARPNPARGSTSIGYQVAKTSKVMLEIYNVTGQRITQFDEGVRQPGHYSIGWDASQQPAGIYFYRLRAGEWQAIRKLMVIR